jgi:hypothetical protein
MEVTWSMVGAIWRMLEDFPLLLLHDNARPHTANKTNETLRNFKWVDIIKMDRRERGWDLMDWINLAQDRDQWRALVNTVMNLRVP